MVTPRRAARGVARPPRTTGGRRETGRPDAGPSTALDSKQLRRTVVIENVAPTVDAGRYPIKREVGDSLEVSADIFKEGHETLVAFLK